MPPDKLIISDLIDFENRSVVQKRKNWFDQIRDVSVGISQGPPGEKQQKINAY